MSTPRTKSQAQKIILGLDPGLGRMGYAVLKGTKHKPTIVAVGCAETSPKLAHSERLLAVGTATRKLIAKHRPAKVAVERLFFSRNVKTAMAVAEARGVILVEIARARLPLVELSPQQVKTAATGDATADKLQVQKMLKLLFKLERAPQPDDAADALAVALGGLLS